MNLDVGDYFTIEQGKLLAPSVKNSLVQSPALYDKTYDGIIFKVLAQEHTFVACQTVFPVLDKPCFVSINLKNIEVMPFTQQYIDVLVKGYMCSIDSNVSQNNDSINLINSTKIGSISNV